MPSATNKKVTVIVLTVSKIKHKTETFLFMHIWLLWDSYFWMNQKHTKQPVWPDSRTKLFYESVLLMTISKIVFLTFMLFSKCLWVKTSLFERNPRKWEFCVRAKDFPMHLLQRVQVGHLDFPQWQTKSDFCVRCVQHWQKMMQKKFC